MDLDAVCGRGERASCHYGEMPADWLLTAEYVLGLLPYSYLLQKHHEHDEVVWREEHIHTQTEEEGARIGHTLVGILGWRMAGVGGLGVLCGMV